MNPIGTQPKPTTEARLIYRSAAMHTLMHMVERVARSSAAVLITGESGVGKELVARAVHRSSIRRDHPLVDINCAALPENLIESELFGYEKGAFSGADSTRPGLFESADGGSLFLDEVGDLDLRLQVKLLRVLDGAPFYRLGGREKISVDVRIIAATNQPLEQSVQTGRFRLDLFHRLSQFQLRVPPLRVRPDDIEELATYFAQQQQEGATFSRSALDALRAYRWPGNVRELRNVITQAVLMATENRVTTVQLPIEVASGASLTNKEEAGPPDLDSVEQKTILEALVRNQSNQTKTAKELGISRRTLVRKLRQYREKAEQIAAAENLGIVRGEQQQSFRFSLSVPATVEMESGENFVATVANISAGGLSLRGVPDATRCVGILQLGLKLPDDGPAIHAKARRVWSDTSGNVGLCFMELTNETWLRLQQWLVEKQREEGWQVQS